MSAKATTASAPATLGVPGKAESSSSITPVAWMPTREMGLAEWTAAGRRLGAMGRCGQWGLGDWIRYGNAKFGERYARAASITGYDVQTLMNMVYVASRFEISRRRENLSWSHHETLAALDPAVQDHWLDQAVTKRLSVSDLRLELRSAKRNGERLENGRADNHHAHDVEPHGSAGLVCPSCGHIMPLPARYKHTAVPAPARGDARVAA
jgi:hypothetical protein